MGKARKSKRQLVRDEKRAKQKRGRDEAAEEPQESPDHSAKRQRRDQPQGDGNANHIPLGDDDDDDNAAPVRKQPRADYHSPAFEREFFGMLAEEEQEYFRHADELLELNDFPSPEERDIFLQNVYKEAEGKELKLVSSQSCSRLMERLILLSNTRQKKSLFEAFAGHFISLVTHMFAGHCCEKLFLQSAPVVTQELSGLVEPEPEPEVEVEVEAEDGEEKAKPAAQESMEVLFLLTLDELEEHLSFLVSDRYGSHALRALLVILSGRPLNQVGTKSMLQSKKKEYVTVEGAAAMASELSTQTRAIPASFTTAIKKIISDTTAGMDITALRVLARHPTGNPTLQLLLELEFSLATKTKKVKVKKGEEREEEKEAEKEAAPEEEAAVSLVDKLIPGAPASFSDEESEAATFINGMMYDPIGSRLLETLIIHCPGKIFKGILAIFFAPRIQTLLRNDIASYPAIRVLNRLSKEDLADAVGKSLPEFPSFVEKGRFNVIKTFFERCSVRQASDQFEPLLKALTAASGGDWKHLVPNLCFLNEDAISGESKKTHKFQPQDIKNKTAMLSHGSQLISTLLSIPGQPTKAIQASLLSLTSQQILRMGTGSAPTSAVLVKALSTASQNPHFHKILVVAILPHVMAFTSSQYGNLIINAIIAAPSKGEGISVPFHLKENIISRLAEHEAELRETWLGRNAWKTWRGDLWSHRRHDWVRWAKEADPVEARVAAAPKARSGLGLPGAAAGAGKERMQGHSFRKVVEEEAEKEAASKETDVNMDMMDAAVAA
ncbi:armadillo-type protein [Lasiosphaeria hispida]|uniref:Nucleolar protein 9 n=1 Tax=Lasiosphaeria hispida TaxID=260671 RepID=A0AAJ0MAZ0_9PEZI|nr:armadillo-type protein [Lasiosphaeria hispida]